MVRPTLEPSEHPAPLRERPHILALSCLIHVQTARLPQPQKEALL
jgi:hypothetical protein